MNLIDAAQAMERLHNQSVLEPERQALWTARNALLVIVSEGFDTLDARLRGREARLPRTETVVRRIRKAKRGIHRLRKAC